MHGMVVIDEVVRSLATVDGSLEKKNNFSSRKQIKLSQTTLTKHHALCSQEKVQRKVEMRYSQTWKLILGMVMFSRDVSERYCCLVSKSCLTLATSWTVALQAPPSMGFPRQQYWSGLPSPSPGDPPDPGIEPSLLLGRWILYH